MAGVLSIPQTSARAKALAQLDDGQDALSLITEVEKRRVLWDITSTEWNPKGQEKAWNEVIAILKCEKKTAKYKWRGLMRRMTSVMVSGKSEEDKRKQFHLYANMKFVENKINSLIAAEEKKAKAKANSQCMPPSMTLPGPMPPLTARNRSAANHNLQHQNVYMSDEDFFASIEYFVAQIDPEDQIGFRIEILKLLRYWTYEKNKV